MSRPKRRLSFFVLALASLFVPLFIIHDESVREKIYSTISVVLAAISGILSISKREDHFPFAPKEEKVFLLFRALFHSDEKLAIAFVQMAVMAQGLAVIGQSIVSFFSPLKELH